MNLVTVTLATIVDRALQEARSHYEVGRPCLRSVSLDATANTFTLNVAAAVGDILEFAAELMLVTAKNTDPNPIYTVARGWNGSTAVAHSANETGFINPSFTRKGASEGAQRSLSAIEAGNLPILRTARYTPTVDPNDALLPTPTGQLVVELAADTSDVWYVRNGIEDIPRARFRDNLPVTVYTTGRCLFLPLGWQATWNVDVTRLTPYRWSTYPAAPTEAATLEIPEGAEFLPSCYATAWLLTGREVSRSEIDRTEEYSRTIGLRDGVTRAVVREAWSTFYRKMDEARRLNPPIAPMREYIAWSR